MKQFQLTEQEINFCVIGQTTKLFWFSWNLFSTHSLFQSFIICSYIITINMQCLFSLKGFLGGSDGKESICQCRRHGFDPWVGKIPWRRKWQATPVFLPGKPHGQSSLVGYSPWGWKESDKTELTEQQKQQTAVKGSWYMEGNDSRKNSYIYIVNGKREGERRWGRKMSMQTGNLMGWNVNNRCTGLAPCPPKFMPFPEPQNFIYKQSSCRHN